MSIRSFFQTCLTVASVVTLTGCSYAMHDAMFGHGKEVKATPEQMKADAEWIINYFESSCLQKPGNWKSQRCEQVFTTQWDTWSGSYGWFEALTRGYDTFDQVLKSHYAIVGGDHVVSYAYRKGWERKTTRSWSYLLGDGSTILTLDRVWHELPNEFETAIVEERIRFTIGLEYGYYAKLNNRALQKCVSESKTTALVQCPAFMESIGKRPENFNEQDLRRVGEGMERIDRTLASLAAKGADSKALYDKIAADNAERKRRSAQAISAGIRQGLANFDPSVKSLPFSTRTSKTGTGQSGGQYAKLSPGVLDRLEKREQELKHQASNKTVTTSAQSGGRQKGQLASSPVSSQPSESAAESSRSKSAQVGTGTESAAREKPIKQYAEAIAYCWQNKNNYWLCHGPVQKLLVGEKQFNKAWGLVGCTYLDERRSWSFKDGRVFGCDIGLEKYDDDVAAIYNVPASIRNNLYQYACPVSYLGRCRSRQ